MAADIVDFLLARDDTKATRRVTEVEPVLLSLCCYQLNRRRKRPAKIDKALLQDVGKDILKTFYAEALLGMPPRVAVFIEDNLILGERFRNSYPREAALAPDGVGAEELERQKRLTETELNTLTQRRLLRVDPQGGEPRVELIHDRLVNVVREARDERRAREEQERDLAEQKALDERKRAEEEARIEREKAEERARFEREKAEEEARFEREKAEERAAFERDKAEAGARHERERLKQAEDERARVVRWRNGLAVAVAALALLTGGLVWSQWQLSQASKAANSRADEVAQARGDAMAELEKVKEALTQQQRVIAIEDAAASGAAPSRAVVEKVNEATREALNTVAAAQQKIQESKALSAGDETDKPAPPAAATAAPAGAAPAPVAAAPAAAPPLAPPRPEEKPATAAARPAAPGGKELPLDWRLSSGGCLKGDVTAAGEATFWIESEGNNVIVRERFEAKGNSGFTVNVKDTGKAVPRSTTGYYDVDTQGDWRGPNGRQFKSRGVDRVYVKDGGLTPTRANVLRFKTECP